MTTPVCRSSDQVPKGLGFRILRWGGLWFSCFLMLSFSGHAQKEGRVGRFINNYEAFVNEVVATPISDFHGDTLNHFQKQQRCFMRRYRWYYDTRMSVEQLEYFNRLCGRYKHKMNVLNRYRRFAAAKGRIMGRLEDVFHDETDFDTSDFDSVPIEE